MRFVRHGNRRHVVRSLMISYAKKDGGPVLKSESKWWRNINGFIYHARAGTFGLYFRRYR